MSKKSRRLRAKSLPAGKATITRAEQRIVSSKSIAEAKPSVPSVNPSAPLPGAHRYQYLLPELRNIGIIAGALFIILIVLTFIFG